MSLVRLVSVEVNVPTLKSVSCLLQSVVARGLLNSIQEKSGYVPVYINFSAQTSSARTQEIIESKLEKKRKNILGTNDTKLFNNHSVKNVYEIVLVVYTSMHILHTVLYRVYIPFLQSPPTIIRHTKALFCMSGTVSTGKTGLIMSL